MKLLQEIFAFISISVCIHSNDAVKLRTMINEKLAVQNETGGATMPLNFDFQCWDFSDGEQSCNFRLLAQVGGRNLLVDSGSSTLAFSEEPTAVTNQALLILSENGENVTGGFCNNDYGGGSPNASGITQSHGWQGLAYTGNVFIGNDELVMNNVIYSIMNGSVGGVQNWEGTPSDKTLGTKAPLGGIWGIGGSSNNYVTNAALIDQNSWHTNYDQCYEKTNEANGDSVWINCICGNGPELMVPDTLMEAMSKQLSSTSQKWSINWDGTYSNKSNEMQFGDISFEGLEDGPEVALEYSGASMKSNGHSYYQFEIESMQYPNGTGLTLPNWQAIFDTGTSTVNWPESMYDYLSGLGDSLNDSQIFTFNLKGKNGITVPFEIKITQEMIEYVNKACYNVDNHDECKDIINENLGINFVPDTSSFIGNIWGLSIFRWLEKIGVDFSKGDMFFKGKVRENPISAPFFEIPESL